MTTPTAISSNTHSISQRRSPAKKKKNHSRSISSRHVFLSAGTGIWSAFVYLVLLFGSPGIHAQDLPQRLGLQNGKQLYQAACVACHGANGEGASRALAGFEPPETFPHFNKCDETTPESTRNWKAVIRDGGPARGFSEIMPAFGDVLTDKQINQLVVYLRSLCTETKWPVGELNVPRALVTEKAIPESETVLSSAVNVKRGSGVGNELAYERILGKRDQLEVAIPIDWVHQEAGGVSGGLGDIAVGVKHVLFSRWNPRVSAAPYDGTGSILSVQGEVVLPTGDQNKGLGTGETAVGFFAAYDQVLPASVFLQLQAGVDLPFHGSDAVPRAAFFRSAIGKTFAVHEFGRLWTPMVEFIADRDLVTGATTEWDTVPEFQVTLSRRQHVRAALGYRVPLNATEGRPRQIVFYLLWDWLDGGLREGW